MRVLSLGWPGWRRGRRLLAYLVAAAAIAFVYLWHLGSAVPGLSPDEHSAVVGSHRLHYILNTSVDLPWRVVEYLLQHLTHHSIFWLRFGSAMFAIFFAYCFYRLLCRWFGRVVALLGSLLFLSTPVITIAARSSTPDILLLSPIIILVCSVWLARYLERLWWVVPILAVLLVLTIYVPGMIWLVAASAIIFQKKLRTATSLLDKKQILLTALVTLVFLVPLLWTLVHSPSDAKALVLIPNHWLSLKTSLKNIGWQALALFWRWPSHNPLILGRLPIFGLVQIALMIFGLYGLGSRARKELTVLIGMALVGIIGSGLDQNPSLLILAVPSLSILVAAGLRYLYIEWRGIFPRNPIPLGLAIGLMSVLVALQVAVGLKYSLIAWPHSQATKQTYMLKY